MKGGRVLEASFLWKGDLVGPAMIQREAEACTGQYSTIVEGRTSVSGGLGVNPWGGIFSSMYSTNTTEKAQRGMAVAVCPSGMTFECEYVTNAGLFSLSGHGACKDNRGESYRLMF